MKWIISLALAFSSNPVIAEIEVTFENAEAVRPLPESYVKLEATLLEERKEREPLKPMKLDGVVAYYSGLHQANMKPVAPESFNKLKKGMSLRQIVTLLGPGFQNRASGVGMISWQCEDGRTLQVWPQNIMDAQAEYFIMQQGRNQRHGAIKKLAKTIISEITIHENKASITFSMDINSAKDGQTKEYLIGDTFQNVDPLPRIDFTIVKIEQAKIYCSYFYQAPADGLLRYSEYGNLILHDDK